MNTHGFILIILLVAPATVGLAQERVVGGVGSFHLTVQQQTTDALNTRLTGAGYPSLATAPVTLGGSGYGFIRNLVLGGEGGGFYQARSVRGDAARQFGGGMGFVDVGYVVRSATKLLVYPVVGIGGGGVSLLLQRTGESIGFSSLLANPAVGLERQGTTLTYGSLLGRIAINADYFPTTSSAKHSGMLIGLSVGYRTTLSDSGWRTAGALVADAPVFTLSGFYASLKLGGGFWKRK